MHASDKVHKQKHVVLIACFLLTTIPLYYGAWQFRIAHHQREAAIVPTTVWSDGFVEEWLSTQVIHPFDPRPLKQYCALSKWQPNVVWRLADANGGVGNIRSNFLDFFLFAIEAGVSIVLPDRATRSKEDLFNVWAGTATFETFFDEEWFMQAMKQACPQMTIYKANATEQAIHIDGWYYPRSRRTYADPAWTKTANVQDFYSWLKGRPEYKEDKRVIIDVGRTIWEHDTRALPYGVRRTLGQVLRITPAVRRMAAIVIQQLGKVYKIEIDPRQPVPRGKFLGAHLRTETDAAAAGWLNAPNTNFTAQTDAYMAQAVHNKLRVLYVASGDAQELERFTEKAAAYEPPLNITDKLDLLNSTQLDELNELTWDQQALVDYEVLQRCSVFGGFIRSSFSYNVALTRNQWLEDNALVVDPWEVLHSEEAVAFDDGLSRIIGRDDLHESLIPRGMFP